MFGYVKPENGELLVRESEQYKGVYCALCKALGKHYGIAARLTLSYDCTFLALFQIGLQPECAGFHKGRCVVNPLKKCTFCTGHTETLKFPSALSVISMYYKLKDDIADSGFWGKLRSYCLMPLAIRPYKKASRDYPALAELLKTMTKEQQNVENQTDICLDSCAEPSAQMLSQVFGMAAGEDVIQKRIFETIGYFLGKWIYVIDAADDLEDDLKKGSFNPLISLYQLKPTASQEQLQEAKAYCNGVLNLCLSQIIASVNLIHFYHFGPIIENIVEKGLPETQRTLLFEKEKNTHDRSL